MSANSRFFQAGIIIFVLLACSFAQAETKGKIIPTPDWDRPAPSTTSQPPPPTVTQQAPSTTSQPPPPTATQTAPPTAVRDAQASSLPDLVISEYSLSPSPPNRQAVVDVRIGVYNQGGAKAGPFTVQWWPSDNYRKPGCTWRIEGLVPNGGRILKCSGYVYPSWYGRINTGVYVDSDKEVREVSKRNNKHYKETPVTQ